MGLRYAFAAFVSLAIVQGAFAAQAPQFVNPGPGPTSSSPLYVGASNGSLPKVPVVSGKMFDRVTQVSLPITMNGFEDREETHDRSILSLGIPLFPIFLFTFLLGQPNLVTLISPDDLDDRSGSKTPISMSPIPRRLSGT